MDNKEKYRAVYREMLRLEYLIPKEDNPAKRSEMRKQYEALENEYAEHLKAVETACDKALEKHLDPMDSK